jgi:4a-hydroxytetrahydrobiopterin dehydratase
MTFAEKSCKPCRGETLAMSNEEAGSLLKEFMGWSLVDGHLHKDFKFKDFMESIGFVNNLAEVAEKEDHHPNISIQYNKVSIDLWTHAINGLSENDFILAAKMDKILLS